MLSSAAPQRTPPLVIGELCISPPILLAPMAGLTNLPMRVLCEEAGCGLTITEFLPAPALAAGNAKEIGKLQPSPNGRPFGVQLFGRDPGQIGRAAALAAAKGASLVDLNMGCPAKKVTKGVAGAALMKEPELAAALVRSALAAVGPSVRVPVKIRSGWDERQKNAPEFAQRMVEAGASAVTVHGRTRMQGFTGCVDLQSIADVKRAVSVPVIGNGDVVDAASVQRMFEVTGCDGVMIGRAALGNPWIFSEARSWWQGTQALPAVSVAERLSTYRRHLELYLEIADNWHAVVEMRKFAGWYLRGFAGSAQLRKTIYGITEVQELFRLVESMREDTARLAAPADERDPSAGRSKAAQA